MALAISGIRTETADSLIGRIYETAVLPEQWPDLLDRIAHSLGALGGNLIRSHESGINLISSPSIEETAREFDRQGWNQNNSRVSRRLERASYPGFLADIELHTIEEINSLPMYTEFLTPRGASAGSGTVIQGAENDIILVAIEGFPSHQRSLEASGFLDGLRPHLARATTLSSHIRQQRAKSLVEAFNLMGLAIALLDVNGRVIRASDQFALAFDDLLLDGTKRLQIPDKLADRRFAEGLVTMRWQNSGCSIAIRDSNQMGRAVLHLVPARRDAVGMFDNVHLFAILANPDNHALPDADIIAALFDLTPAEARVARAVAENRALAELAQEWGISVETIRSQLKRVFAKTSTARQGELVSLLARLAG
jgi:DNA-binding CsgD family transcriptional regulator